MLRRTTYLVAALWLLASNVDAQDSTKRGRRGGRSDSTDTKSSPADTGAPAGGRGARGGGRAQGGGGRDGGREIGRAHV